MWGPIIGAAAGLIGAGMNSAKQDKINRDNANLQREFAQNSIQWRVEDAKRAGIHPLAALGASGYSASPSSVGADNGIAQAGQIAASGLSKVLDRNQAKLSDLEVRSKELDVIKQEKELSDMGQKLSPFNIFNSGQATPTSSIFSGADGTPPTSGFSNNIIDDQPLTRQAGRIFKVDNDLQISELPPSDNGKRRFHLGPNPDSILGQMLSDGGIINGTLAQITQFNRIRKSLNFVENWAREKGLIGPDEEFDKNIINHTLDGFQLEIKKKDPPKQQYRGRQGVQR